MPPKRKPRKPLPKRSAATKPKRALSNRVVVGNNPASKYTPLGAFVDPPTTSPREIAFHKKHSKKIIASIAAISALAVLSHRQSKRTPYYHTKQASKIMASRVRGVNSPPQSPLSIDRLRRAHEAVSKEENLLDGLNAGLDLMARKTTAAEHMSYAALKTAKKMDRDGDKIMNHFVHEFREWV
jgi:hypothetical protein